ncbi:MAG: RibD family protein, partial [Methanoculleaceae archaeon]
MSEITVDGKLTIRPGASSKILMAYMDPETERLLHRTRAECDAIMVGSRTIRIDDSRLTVRLVEGRSPLRVIPASRGDIPPGANVLSPEAPTLIAVSRAAPAENISALEEHGAVVEVVGEDRVDLPRLLDLLYTK